MSRSMDRIVEMSRAVYAWSTARTANAADADDLSQEVLLAMTQALPSLKNEQAFYGFMWSVAHHVYRQWLRKKRSRPPYAELREEIAAEDPFGKVETSEEICLLRRELTLLNQRYREAVVLYYVRGLRVGQIARQLAISESMVKYLLFKARNILKEGMEMERNYGEQSYHPRRLDLRYWGEGPNHYYGMAGTLLRQNILFACYNDALTAEQIALAVGVGLPYMEDDLHQMHEVELLTKDSAGKYRTNIILFTEDFAREAAQLGAPECCRIAELTKQCVQEKEKAVRALDFMGADMNGATYTWQMTALLLNRAIIDLAWERAAPSLPKDKWGAHCVCWGVEEEDKPDNFAFGVTNVENAQKDWVRCMDFPINGEMVYLSLRRKAAANVFLSIARGEADSLSENDAAEAAEFVRKGYVVRGGKGLTVKCPVFTQKQYTALLSLIDGAAREIAALALAIREKEADLLQEHAPKHLKTVAAGMAYFRLFEDAISKPVAQLCAERFLPDAKTADLLPAAYVVLA